MLVFELLVNIIDPPIAAFPDIPTPPHTTKAPLPLNKVSVVELIKRSEVNVFAPAIVWARVVISYRKAKLVIVST